MSVKSPSVCATRRSTLIVIASVTTAAVVAALAIGQTGVTGAEKAADDSPFTVVGDGELPTTRPALGDSREPLSTDEAGYAIHLASTDPSIPDTATNVRGEAGPQLLYADIPDTDVDAGGRTAIVVLYDYTHDKTYYQSVDLKTGTLRRSEAGTRLQPPTTSDEADAAIAIALGVARPPRFVAEFETSESVPLISAEQVSYVASSWVFDGTTASGAECGMDRCARLMVTTPSGAYLDTTDFVVDLSEGDIVRLDPS